MLRRLWKGRRQLRTHVLHQLFAWFQHKLLAILTLEYTVTMRDLDFLTDREGIHSTLLSEHIYSVYFLYMGGEAL
jgi:hypothetical protein